MSFIRSKVRTQNSWLLHLAGDFHSSFETKQLLHRRRQAHPRVARATVLFAVMPCGAWRKGRAWPHQMRVMLTSNLAVDQRFANGTQGRLLHWSPTDVEGAKRAVPASHPDICARFVKESSVQKRGQLLPEIDTMDIQVRQENLNIRGAPIMLQLPLVPAYALTVHKTQALSIRHLVLGCASLSCKTLNIAVPPRVCSFMLFCVGVVLGEVVVCREAWRAALLRDTCMC